jgi:protein-tyrosine phosphatase
MEFIGALKVKDGLFIGDEFSAQDLEFVVANKVTHIINCASKQVANHWEAIGVKYFSLYWQDSDIQIIVDKKAVLFNKLFDFIESTLSMGESVLVHSVRGQCRCICVVTAYMMRKYRWNLFKTLEFINFRRPDMEIRPNFLSQLANLEKKYAKKGLIISSDWNETDGLTDEELLLRNTYLNAQLGPIVEENDGTEAEKNFMVRWTDNGENVKEKLVDVSHAGAKNPVVNGFVVVHSCIKGGNKETRVTSTKPKKKNLNKVEELFGSMNSKVEKVIKLNHNDLAKLTASLEEGWLEVKRVPKTSKSSQVTRSFSATQKTLKEKTSPSKKLRPKTGYSPHRSKKS